MIARNPARALSVALLLIGLALISASALAQGSLAVFTAQKSIGANTFTSDPCFPNNNTGFRSPSAQVADTGGDGDGFEVSPTNAFADGGGYAENTNGPGDRHRYYNYGISIDASCTISGIQVRLDWWLSSTTDTNSMSVALSWDGGTSWTAAKTDTVETTTEHTTVLGGSTDTWGRAWTAAELSNANFRVRITNNCSGSFCSLRDYFLDWVPVKAYYGP